MAHCQLKPDTPVENARILSNVSDESEVAVNLASRSFPRRILPQHVHHEPKGELCESFDYFYSTDSEKISSAVLWLITLLTAIILGFVKGGVYWMSTLLWDARIDNMTSLIVDASGSIYPGMGVYIAYAAVFGVFATVLTVNVREAGGGGGIADIKMFLNGNILHGFLSKRALFVRVFGISLVTSCGAMLGPEGPMAHVGTIVSVLIPELFFGALTDRQRYDFATVGSGMGIASAFNAPLAGTLFALEEAASFWHPDLITRTLVGALVTAIVGQYVSAGFVCENETFCVSYSGDFGFTDRALIDAYFHPWEMPIFLVLGVFMGVLAVVFTFAIMQISRIYKVIFSILFLKILASAIIFGFTAIFFSLLTLSVHCESTTGLPVEGVTIAGSMCPGGQINSIALILLESREFSIQSLFSSTDEICFSQTALVVCGIAVFFTAAISACLTLPAGLFIPMVLCGACFGRLFGDWASLVTQSSLYTGIYALAGAAGFLSGVSRMTLWIALVMLESSGNLHLAVPVMLSIASAKFVADLIQPVGLYEQMILARKVKYLPNEDWPASSCTHTVSTVMETPVVCFFQSEKRQFVLQVLALCRHSTFPVIDGEEHIVGIARRSDILAQTPSEEITLPISYIPISVHYQFPTSNCYYIFSQLGVKVVTIVDRANRILGIITRENLMHHQPAINTIPPKPKAVNIV